MFVRRINDNWVVCARYGRNTGRISKLQNFRHTHIVKATDSNSSYSGMIDIGTLCFPQEFIGKRIILKVIIK